jgi:hypothetical protein
LRGDVEAAVSKPCELDGYRMGDAADRTRSALLFAGGGDNRPQHGEDVMRALVAILLGLVISIAIAVNPTDYTPPQEIE